MNQPDARCMIRRRAKAGRHRGGITAYLANGCALDHTQEMAADESPRTGAIRTEGSPRIEETIYWFNLLIDTTQPICGNAAQRAAGHDQQ